MSRRQLFLRWAIGLSVLLLLANCPKGSFKGSWAGFPLVFWTEWVGREQFFFDAFMIDVGVWLAFMWLAWLCAWSRCRFRAKRPVQ